MKCRSFSIWAAILAAVATVTVHGSPARSAPESERPGTVLSRDVRLRRRMTVPNWEMSMQRFFSRVQRATAVHLYTEDLELRDSNLIAACEGTTAESLLDAVAALWLLRWEKDEENRYRLLGAEHEMKVFLPDNEYERDKLDAGRRFLREWSNLSAPVQASLISGVQPSALPSGLVDEIGAMTDAVNRELQALQGDTNPFPLQRLAEARLTLKPRQKGRVTSYWMTLSLQGWGSLGWSFNDYDPRGRREGKLEGAAYVPGKLEVTRKEAKKLPALQKRVTLYLKAATLPEVMQKLSRSYRFPFVSDPNRGQKRRVEVHFKSIPLADALDRLTQLYPGAEWEYRKSGFLIMRSPGNPAAAQPSREANRPG